jgi:hypothetical protein
MNVLNNLSIDIKIFLTPLLMSHQIHVKILNVVNYFYLLYISNEYIHSILLLHFDILSHHRILSLSMKEASCNLIELTMTSLDVFF